MHIGGAFEPAKKNRRTDHALAEILASTSPGDNRDRSRRQGGPGAGLPVAAKRLVNDTQLRHTCARDRCIRNKRARVVAECRNGRNCATTAHEIKEHTLRHLDFYLEQFERPVRAPGERCIGRRDADEANRIIRASHSVSRRKGSHQVKTMTSDEVQLNPALQQPALHYETDLADLIVQLGEDEPSHTLCRRSIATRWKFERSSSKK